MRFWVVRYYGSIFVYACKSKRENGRAPSQFPDPAQETGGCRMWPKPQTVKVLQELVTMTA